jgi:hypothetical protein
MGLETMNASGHAHAAKRRSPPLGRGLAASDERQTVRRLGSVTYHALNVFLSVYAKSIHFTPVYPFLSLRSSITEAMRPPSPELGEFFFGRRVLHFSQGLCHRGPLSAENKSPSSV